MLPARKPSDGSNSLSLDVIWPRSNREPHGPDGYIFEERTLVQCSNKHWNIIILSSDWSWSQLNSHDIICNSNSDFKNYVASTYASVNSTCAAPPPPPGLLRGIFPPCRSRGWGICKFCIARGPGIYQPPGHSRTFDTHAVFYQNITTQKVLLEKTQIGSSVKDRNKL